MRALLELPRGMLSKSKQTMLMLARKVVAAGWTGQEDLRLDAELCRSLLADPTMAIPWDPPGQP
eukprot:6150452-Prorocentrum_lima.AAC.1